MLVANMLRCREDMVRSNMNVSSAWTKCDVHAIKTWCNWYLNKKGYQIERVSDLEDGIFLNVLLELLLGTQATHLPQPSGKSKQNGKTLRDSNWDRIFHLLGVENASQLILDKYFVEANDKSKYLLLRILWHIILNYQLSKQIRPFNMDDLKTESDELLKWVNRKVRDYRIKNWNKDWVDGKALCLLVNAIRPGCIPDSDVHQKIQEIRIQAACSRAEKELGVPDLILPEELSTGVCKEEVLITYIAFLRDVDQLQNDPETMDEIKNDKIVEDKPSSQVSSNFIGIPFRPSRCLAFGSGLRWGQVGKPAEFIMQLNNRVNLSDMLVSIDCRPYDKRATRFRPQLEIKALYGNCYLVKYTPTRPGRYYVNILYGNDHILNSPFEISIKETVVTEDKMDRQLEIGNEIGDFLTESISVDEKIDSILSNIENVKSFLSPDAPLTKSIEYSASYDSAFVDDDELRLLSMSSGEFPLSNKLNLITEDGDLFDNNIQKREVKVTNFKIHGSGLHTGEVGRIATFYVHTPTYLDETGLVQGPLGVSITCPAMSIPIPFVRTKFFPNMLEHNVLYIPTEPGIYEINVKWGDVTICGSPFHLTVLDTVMALPSSTLPDEKKLATFRNTEQFDLFLYYSATTENDVYHQRKVVLQQILTKHCPEHTLFTIPVDIELTMKERRALFNQAESKELPFVFVDDEFVGDYHTIMKMYQENKLEKFFQKMLRKLTNQQLSCKIPLCEEELL